MNLITRAIKNATSNWKTSAAGITAFLIILLQEVSAAMSGGDFNIELVVGALVVTLGLTQARDADKSSEDSGINPPAILLALLLPLFALGGCAGLMDAKAFQSPKARLMAQVADESAGLALTVRALTTARKTGLLSAKQFVGTESHVAALNASIDRAWALLGQDKMTDAKAELDYFKRLLEQLSLYLQRSDHALPSPARSTTDRGRSADPDRSSPASEKPQRDIGGGSPRLRDQPSPIQRRSDVRVRRAA